MWKTDKNGIETYHASIYAKEELPTWNEIYNEWYKKNRVSWDPFVKLKDGELDTYWKIPKVKYLLATVCNEFNKMIFEDTDWFGLDKISDSLLSVIKKNDDIADSSHISRVADVRFVLRIEDSNQERLNINSDKPNRGHFINPPKIYTFKNPNGNPNPFITNYSRIDVTNEDILHMSVMITVEYDDGKQSTVTSVYDPDITNLGAIIINEMIKPFKDYFENGVGWKDKDGNIISEIDKGKDYERAADPAL